MSTCKGCGAAIDWIRTEERKHMPVDPAPVFVLYGEGTDRFVTDEGEVIVGRRATAEEVQKRPEDVEVAFVPHWATCPRAGDFRRK